MPTNNTKTRRRKRGRPESATVKAPLGTRISPDVLAYLRSTGNIAEAIEAAVRSSAGYRTWLERLAPAE